MKQNSNVLIKMALILFVLIGLITVARLRMTYNEIDEQRRALEAESAMLAEKLADAQAEYDRPFDSDYVAQIAKEKLNLCLPQEIVFFSDLND